MGYYIYDNIQIIRAFGVDCMKFLQGQLTNDIALLNERNPLQLNALCNQKGRIIALFFTRYLAENDLLMAIPSNLADHTLQTLRKYAVFSKISFDPCTDYHLVYSSYNNEHEFLLQHSIIHVAQKRVKGTLDVKEVQKSNICQKLPMIDAHNTEVFLPAELNLDQLNTINYQKGCFMGQEIIARMKYRGNMKKLLLSIELENIVSLSDKLTNVEGKNIADIVNQVNIDGTSYVLAVFNHTIENTPIILHGDIRAKIIA